MVLPDGEGGGLTIWTAFYWGDYLRDTQDLDLLGHGAYFKLLAHYYSNEGPLPKEGSRLYRICGAFSKAEQQAVDEVVGRFFQETSSGYSHKRADAELERQREVSKKRAEAGKQGARKRYGDRKIRQFPGGDK